MTLSDTGVEDKPPVDVLFRDLTVQIGNRSVLKDVSGEVRPGEILAIVGPSGRLQNYVTKEFIKSCFLLFIYV